MSQVSVTSRVVLVGLFGLAVGLLASPSAEAQCATGPRHFGSFAGMGLPKLRIDPQSSWDSGAEIGRFWQSANSSLANNWCIDAGLTCHPDMLPLPNGCPSTGNGQSGGGWWQVTATTLRGFNGFVAGSGCEANLCPSGDFTVIVEDYGPTGPPGINDTAYFIAHRVDETTGGARWWDLSKVGQDGGTLLMLEYPRPTITASAANGNDRQLTMNYANISFHSHVGHESTNPIPISDLDVIESYDLLLHTGTSDPGRNRFATGCAPPNPGGRCWTLIHQRAFTGSGPENVQVTVPCNSQLKDSYIALGVTFDGGTGPAVPSALVGRAIQVECSPNIAAPQLKPRPGIREARPARPARGGR
jgi:hypothetical protein